MDYSPWGHKELGRTEQLTHKIVKHGSQDKQELLTV